jgi:hypothetical protein
MKLIIRRIVKFSDNTLIKKFQDQDKPLLSVFYYNFSANIPAEKRLVIDTFRAVIDSNDNSNLILGWGNRYKHLDVTSINSLQKQG